MTTLEILLHCSGPDFSYTPGEIIKEADEDKALYLINKGVAKVHEPPPDPPWIEEEGKAEKSKKSKRATSSKK